MAGNKDHEAKLDQLMLTKEIILESIAKPKNIFRRATSERKDRRTWLISQIIRFLSVAVAAAQIYVFRVDDFFLFRPVALITGVLVYVLIETTFPMRWYHKRMPLLILLGTDVILSIFLILTTGGLYSPFLMFTLLPVLRSGLFMNGRITAGIALISAVYVGCVHLFNPYFNLHDDSELSFYFIYFAAIILSSILPYLINVNFRQRLQEKDVLQERQRISHEIHDGYAQTVAALRWQVQLLQRRLKGMGIDLKEAAELERLANQAQFETRESLELLRNYHGRGDFLPYLKEYLEKLKKQTGIQYNLEVDLNRIHLEPGAELELLRICQEALVNVRKHAQATHVDIFIKPWKDAIKVTIADDGCGFDVAAHSDEVTRGTGHGLAIMRERAESIGAKIEMISSPGQGAHINVEVPSGERWK
jgi:signal transduction histidine kinase